MKYDDCIKCKKMIECKMKGESENCVSFEPRIKCAFSNRSEFDCDEYCQYFRTCTRKQVAHGENK